MGNEDIRFALSNGETVSDAQLAAVTQDLQEYYRELPVASTVQVPIPQSDAVVAFDCVPTLHQPSLRSHARHGTVPHAPERPPVDPEEMTGPQTAPKPESPLGASKVATPDPKAYVVTAAAPACPPGTVPLQRNSLPEAILHSAIKEDALGTQAQGSSGDKPTAGLDRNAYRSALGRGAVLTPQADIYRHRYAHAFQAVANHGGAARLNVWSPQVLTNDMSLSQIWVVAGDPDNNSLQTVEAGWQVMSLWQSKYSALFVYQTSDNYISTGCYVTKCGGTAPVRPESFVITSNKIIVGKPIPVQTQSTVGGPQGVVEVKWIRNDKTGSWWLKVDGDWVGYYPSAVFNKGPLSNAAAYVDFGGEATGTRATSEMGSGHYAQEGKGYAGFQSRLRYFDIQNKTVGAAVVPSATDDPCYTIVLNAAPPPEDDAGAYFYFGGPGVHHFAQPPPINEACSPPPSGH
jgi:hypothetical protein